MRIWPDTPFFHFWNSTWIIPSSTIPSWVFHPASSPLEGGVRISPFKISFPREGLQGSPGLFQISSPFFIFFSICVFFKGSFPTPFFPSFHKLFPFYFGNFRDFGLLFFSPGLSPSYSSTPFLGSGRRFFAYLFPVFPTPFIWEPLVVGRNSHFLFPLSYFRLLGFIPPKVPLRLLGEGI